VYRARRLLAACDTLSGTSTGSWVRTRPEHDPERPREERLRMGTVMPIRPGSAGGAEPLTPAGRVAKIIEHPSDVLDR
jgi:hypothetical protein